MHTFKKEIEVTDHLYMKKYYEAYDERYKTIHDAGCSWAGDEPTPIVLQSIKKYGVGKNVPILEIGCGEGRDAIPLMKIGYDLTASDVSAEAVSYCKKKAPEFADRFKVSDCLKNKSNNVYGFIYSVAVIHMLLPDGDRDAFYRFIKDHLTDEGAALICSMGDGVSEFMTDINEAFEMRKREHPSGEVTVAATSLRMIPFETFEKEIERNGLRIIEKGLTESPPEFDKLMYAVVRKEDRHG